MKKRDVIYATADYTGGGIYVMTGKFQDGTWFATDNRTSVAIYDVDPWSGDPDEAFNEEFNDAHLLTEYCGPIVKRIIDEALGYIRENEPDGNYAMSEVREYFSR